MSASRLSSSLVVLVCLLALPAPASATTLTNAFNWDINDFSGFGNGSIGDGTSDAYDGCYAFNIGTAQYAMTGTGASSLSLSGRQVDMPPVDVGMGLMAERHIYVPPSPANWARFVDLVENTSASTVTTTLSITGNLGSDGGTVLMATSSGDTVLATDDTWFATDDVDGSGDPSLAHVARGDGGTVDISALTLSFDNVNYTWNVTIPPGGRVAIMTFAVQASNQSAAQATAVMLEGGPDDSVVGIDDWSSDIINWGLASSGVCTGADGLACSAPSGASGICHAGRCCTGCWDGTRCLTGRVPDACGIAGGACVRCASVAFCSSAACTAGVCNGSPCDDGESCTTDTCDEATDSCGHSVTSGCIIGGECVGEGEHHVAYPCLVCDTSRTASDWSTEPEGTVCGSARCADGHLFGAGTCDASGFCDAPHPTVCDSLDCNPDGMTCAPVCTETSCPAGQICGPLHHCVPATALGADCTTDAECGSGHCTDGVCCESLCDGTCESCVLPGREGMCKPIPAGTDPDTECGAAMTCDGHGACVGRGTDAGPRDGGVVRDGGSASDAGLMATDGATSDAATEPPPAQACACSAPGRARTSAPIGLGMLGLLALLVSRRRRA